MTRYLMGLVGLFALLSLADISSAQTAAVDTLIDRPSSETTEEQFDSDRRLSNQEIRRHISSLERTSEVQRAQIQRLEQSLASSQSELRLLRSDYQQYETDMAETLSSTRVERLNSEEVLRGQLGRLAEDLASDRKDRLATSEAHTSEISSIAGKVANSEQELVGIARGVKSNSDALELLDKRVARSEGDLAAQGELLNSKFIDVSDAVSMQTIVGSTIAALFGLIVFFLARRMVENRRQLASQISDSSDSLRNEYGDLDLKISELLEQQLSLLSSSINSESTDNEPDHSLPMQVAAEIHRMTKRLDTMPPNTKGVQPLSKALERLVDGLAANDYEIIPLLGMKYVDGMTVQASFILDDDLSPGEQVISRVIKPQVNYKGAVLQVADVEVSFGE